MKSFFDLHADDVLAAVESATLWHFEGAEEIGSSDMSACCRSVFNSLGLDPEAEGPGAWQIVRHMIRAELAEGV